MIFITIAACIVGALIPPLVIHFLSPGTLAPMIGSRRWRLRVKPGVEHPNRDTDEWVPTVTFYMGREQIGKWTGTNRYPSQAKAKRSASASMTQCIIRWIDPEIELVYRESP